MAEHDNAKQILKKILLFAFYTLMSILGADLGFQAGIWGFDTYSSGIFVKWQRLPNSPYETTDILAAGPNGLFAQTTDGIYFNGDVFDCLKQAGRQCWRPVNAVDKSLLTYISCPTHSSHFQVAAPPVPYVQYLMRDECSGESHNETHYLRSQAGELWVWQWGNFSMGMIGPFLFVIGGSVLLGWFAGLLIAITLIRFIKRRK